MRTEECLPEELNIVFAGALVVALAIGAVYWLGGLVLGMVV